MNPFSLISRPINTLAEGILMPLRALFVVGLCWVINAMTFSGRWWVQWVALGMGIAVVVALARAARTLLVLALVAWGGLWLYRRYGQQARDQFDAWVGRTQPQATQVVQMLRRRAGVAGG